MIVEAKRDIPWTKPEDIPYGGDAIPGVGGTISDKADNNAPDKGRSNKEAPLPKLGGHHAAMFLAAFCDGAVRAIPQNIDPGQLRKLIMRDDGQQFDWNALEGPKKR